MTNLENAIAHKNAAWAEYRAAHAANDAQRMYETLGAYNRAEEAWQIAAYA